MKSSVGRALLIVLAIAHHAPAALRADTPNGNTCRHAGGDLRSQARRGQETCAERALCAGLLTPHSH